MGVADDIVAGMVQDYASEDAHPDTWDLDGLATAILGQFGFDYRKEGIDPTQLSSKEIEEALIAKAHEKYDQKESVIGAAPMRYHERMIMLQIVDANWKDHLLAIDQLRDGIGLRGYGQKDPLIEYKREGYDLFAAGDQLRKGAALNAVQIAELLVSR